MNDEHLSLEIDFRYFRPPKMLNSFANWECWNAWKTDSDVELRATIIFHRVRIDTVRLQTACNQYKLVVDRNDVEILLSLSMQLDNFLLKLQWLTKGKLYIRYVILSVNLSVIVAEFIWGWKSEIKSQQAV